MVGVSLSDLSRTSQKLQDQAFQPLEAHAAEEMASEGFNDDRLLLQRLLDVRYVGQSYELTVPSPTDSGEPLDEAVATAFHQAHQRRFGYSDTTQRVEVVNVRLKAVGCVDKPDAVHASPAQAGDTSPIAQTEVIFVIEQACKVDAFVLFDRQHRAAGSNLAGQLKAHPYLRRFGKLYRP